MNWLFFAIVAVFAIYAYIGYTKGFIKIVMSLLTLVLAFCITTAIAPKVSDIIINNTGLYEAVREGTYNSLKNQNVIQNTINEVKMNSGVEDELSSLEDLGGNVEVIYKQVMTKLPVPDSIKMQMENTKIKENVTENINESIRTVEETIVMMIAEKAAVFICNCGTYIAVYLVVYFIVAAVLKVFDIVSRLPVIGLANKLLGVLVSLLKALLLIWLFFFVVNMLYSTAIAQNIMKCVSESSFLTSLYDSNIFMKLLMSITSK